MNKSELNLLIDKHFDLLYAWFEKCDDSLYVQSKTEGKWSSGQHAEHLRKTTRALNKAFQIPSIALWWKFGRLKREENPFDYFWNKYREISVDPDQKFTAPSSMTPGTVTAEDRNKIMSRLREEQENLKNHINKSSERSLSKRAVPHPVFGLMSLREMVYFTAFHTQHHLDAIIEQNP